MAHYLDTSALVKLVIDETETRALRSWLVSESPTAVSSELARTELLRAVRRSDPTRTVLARHVLDALILITPSQQTFDAAGLLEPTVLRSLDALHLASALELADDLDGIVTYDDRMADAARNLGIAVLSPGKRSEQD